MGPGRDSLRLGRQLYLAAPDAALARVQNPARSSRAIPNAVSAASVSRSFYTYGRVVYQGGVQRLFGRWHFDTKNSFTVGETGLHGLFEVTRLSKQDAQSAARSTIGTKLSRDAARPGRTGRLFDSPA